ncbi:N-acetylmuramoyl-L-alanine amidase [Tissierella sp. MSJ-40]|uniref:N-acetylmuramoyl-L-alanine amidase n=1 Tax=Tissierella simiarum TaxID=2841534 RepID=A0ABS6EBQ1_9FIRM|nr:N-acetylmuramoyl-L-alanine amidase [Tissierella simiarum]MBU5439629.1 N-acetylmuramoyl-L-alanine amidase [Tissierella simiarum]
MGNFRMLNFDNLIKELDKYKFKQLHIHHTWKPAHKSFTGNNHIAIQQSMYNYHVNSNGWSDIGQHLTLFPDGAWVTGRPFNIAPASIKGWNTGALAVEMIGNFDIPGTGAINDLGYDLLQGKQREEILKLMRYFINKYGEDSIKFHREGPGVTKTCPGTRLDKIMLIKEAKALTDKKHWAEEHYNNLKSIINITDKRFDDKITRGEAMALVDKALDYIERKVK